VMVVIALISPLIERPFKAINSMGCALIAVLLIEPLAINQLGFQFSFAVTFSILIFSKKTDEALQIIFRKRFLKNSLKINTLNQYGLVLLGFIREAFALSIAVNLAALPLTLYHFGQFPLLSILYNFFFPFMASISMLLLLIGFLLPFSFIDSINTHFTKFLLEFAYDMPQTADWNLYVPDVPFSLLCFYFFLLACLGIFLFKKETKDPLCLF
ncbi:MAG TPA: ComEC/Rec2 family competence protein, partial [Parachlamydiaceae bacterium]|nr:ComEC/Rec2 family competence protein [Parachlamydiaceae bacterium]